jgi:excisionase family DNA binding protein
LTNISQFDNIWTNKGEEEKELSDKNECYSIKEVLELLKITKNTLTNWRKKGIIKTVQIGGRVLIKKEEVERLLKENTK